MSEFHDAMSCLLKSAWLIEGAGKDVWINIGWASFWLGEVLEKSGDVPMAYICFRRAATKWRSVSPFRAEEAEHAASRLSSRVDELLSTAEDWYIERQFLNWVEGARKFHAAGR
jgi:hypothetical protein